VLQFVALLDFNDAYRAPRMLEWCTAILYMMMDVGHNGSTVTPMQGLGSHDYVS
jgi:hypothetical protein